jgi:DNA topoisomerase IA
LLDNGAQPKPVAAKLVENVGLEEDLKKIEYQNKLDKLDAGRKQKYKNILQQLQEMGFLDFDRNMRTVERLGTDIYQVMEDLGKPELKPVMGGPYPMINPQMVRPQGSQLIGA